MGLSACKKEGINTNLDQSLEAWSDFKSSSNNTYSYIAYFGSWTGFHAETKLTVVNGKVTIRKYKSGHYKPNTNELVAENSWTESGATLNTHADGHPLLTIDEVYTKAKREWLSVDKKQNEIYFEAENNGIISSAGYVPKNCADDCFTGIKIKEIKVFVKEIK
ncbi:hypothetical protein DYU05_03660 [Mucilaginibacter terrenus]|uniref:Uncharacterized protein n=1 Tax=Mucilaginibacter terrenus TaxID=2482727 RepID=A0A3E2NUM9_9SPHI|nr:hypothetical protein DYU05_03660 [Mucilaginibacter terrenus]